MKRKIYDRLLEWKEKDHGSCAMLLDGARRVGKSYIADTGLLVAHYFMDDKFTDNELYRDIYIWQCFCEENCEYK